MATFFDVVGRMDRDVIAVCATQETADRQREEYGRTYQRIAYVRKTERPTDTQEYSDLMHLVRDSRQRREEELIRHLQEIERKAKRRMAV